jgi:hypothetical protein
MLGFGGGEMALAYLLCLLAALGCVVYGLIKWNDMGRYGEFLEAKIEWERKDRGLKEHLP